MPGCLDCGRLDRSPPAVAQAGTAGIAGLSLPAYSRPNRSQRLSRRAKHIIFLHQFGGPSHHDTFDMKPSAPAGIRGEFQPIATGQPGLLVSEHLPRFAVIDGFAQVRSVNHRMKNTTRPYYSLTGHTPPVDDIRLRDTQELSGVWEHCRQASSGRGSGGPLVRLVPTRPSRRQRHSRPTREFPGQGV